ncbi:hypothetical protein ACFXPS_05540 [Nocardia sp. NPDC059091]|uniref:hypothetical protein n=1 Tax=unclassified Nocardia TaxID=2637762 RepID=UPI0036B5F0C1
MPRRYAALSLLPLMLAAGQGAAVAAPGQPGLAVPGDGQPGLSTAPSPPAAPSLADYVPDPPAPPSRPRPRQQTSPQPDTLVQPQTEHPEGEQPEAGPEVQPADPHALRVGTTTLGIPDWVDPKFRDKAQSYLDYAEWQIAAAYDGMGFSRDESDRRAASTLIGGGVGAYVGAISLAPLSLAGCGVGMVVGGVAGGIAAGVPTAGAASVLGAAVGGTAGCMVGAVVAAAPAVAVGAAVGAGIGGASAGALGAGVDVPKPADPQPLVNVVAPEPAAVVGSIEQQVSDVADAVAATSPQAAAVVDSLRQAIAAMPQLDPAALGI